MLTRGRPVKPLGVFGPSGPTPFDVDRDELATLRDVLGRDVRSHVVRWVRSGTIVVPFMEYTRDLLDDSFGVEGGSSIVSDGTYYWRRDAAEYIERYGIGLGEEMIEHMRRQGWRARRLTNAEVQDIDDWLSRTLRSS